MKKIEKYFYKLCFFILIINTIVKYRIEILQMFIYLNDPFQIIFKIDFSVKVVRAFIFIRKRILDKSFSSDNF